jgi:ATP-dependent RNA helicase MSS116
LEKQEEDDFFTADLESSPSTSSAEQSTSPSSVEQDAGPDDTHDGSKPAVDAMPFTSLKGRVDHDILKALTVKPFQLKSMSEVQKRVLALMPELSGGLPKQSAQPIGEAEEAEVQVNVAGKKVSTGARGKHDLLVKAKTGTGKTIVRLHNFRLGPY